MIDNNKENNYNSLIDETIDSLKDLFDNSVTINNQIENIIIRSMFHYVYTCDLISQSEIQKYYTDYMKISGLLQNTHKILNDKYNFSGLYSMEHNKNEIYEKIKNKLFKIPVKKFDELTITEKYDLFRFNNFSICSFHDEVKKFIRTILFLPENSLHNIKNNKQYITGSNIIQINDKIRNLLRTSTQFTMCIFDDLELMSNGCTGCCIHANFDTCSFRNFNGKQDTCCKTSIYKNCNFTGANLSGILGYNIAEMKFYDCNLTNVIFTDKKNKRYVGKDLIRYMYQSRICIFGLIMHDINSDKMTIDDLQLDVNIWTD